MEDLFAAHVQERQKRAEAVLAASDFEAMVLHSGTPFRYHADDQDAPFRSNPHFAHWTPLHGPGHLLVIKPGEKPRIVRFFPEDYWYEQSPLGNPYWAASFDIEEVGTEEATWDRVQGLGKVAYLGDSPSRASEKGLTDTNPEELVARLDWDRSTKTEYEIACIQEAQVMAARGHHSARMAFEAGASELQIHQAYIGAVGCTDQQLPYESIVALDEKGAILHYNTKRADVRHGKVLLIDSGAICHGYASDITRTWTMGSCDAQFNELVQGMDQLQQDLCNDVEPGHPYPELHHRGHVLIGDLLQRSGILKTGGEDAVERGLTRPFFPHGLGHFLGIQVHDVAGHQAAPEGGTQSPPDNHPYLRTTRTMEVNQVFTVEPGLYFIEMLLREHRSGDQADQFDWDLIDRLTPYGGVRIEDNVVVTEDGHRNLTRPHI